MAVLLFEFVESLKVAVEVVSGFIPPVSRVVDILVCP